MLGLLATSNQAMKMSLRMDWESQVLLSATDLKLGESGNPPSGKCAVMIEDPESFRNSHLGTDQRKIPAATEKVCSNNEMESIWELFPTTPSSIKSLPDITRISISVDPT